MTDQTTELSILFVDVSDTTGLGETLGSGAARELIAQCITLMQEQVKKHEGEVVRSVGDELMCVFAKPGPALRAVMGIRNAMNEHLPRINPSTPRNLTIRAGLHHGPATRQRNVISGEANRMAGLMAGLARAGQILLTARTVDALPAEARGLTRLAGPFSIPGTDDEVEAHEVGRPDARPQASAGKGTIGGANGSAEAAQPATGAAATPKETAGNESAEAAQPAVGAAAMPKESAGSANKAAQAVRPAATGASDTARKETVESANASAEPSRPTAGASGTAEAVGPCLRLHYRGRETRIGAKEVPLVMGRGKTVNILIADSRASREHARIELREGRFFLVDQSRHGTYLASEGGRRVLQGEEAPLTGAGKIAFGRDPDEASEVIAFTCED